MPTTTENESARESGSGAGRRPRVLRERSVAGVEWLAGGDAASPRGFAAAGVHCGVKRDRLDLALLVSDRPAGAAGVFTSNRVVAPPVVYCRQLLREEPSARAIVVNSGNANACTGQRGWDDTVAMAKSTAEALGLRRDEVLVASTGVIGRPLPMAEILAGIPRAAARLGSSSRGGAEAADAILTTDTRRKTAAARVELEAGPVLVGGMAKGSGMIAPDLIGPHATTLAFFTTDAAIPSPDLQDLFVDAIGRSFNSITVDGDTSTNDTALCLANGASGYEVATDEDRRRLCEGLWQVATALAIDVVRDGEGASRVIEVRVFGAESGRDADRVARTVAESPLVKTAFCAGEPNWGRLMMAVGRAGAVVDPDRVRIAVGGLEIVRSGVGSEHSPEELSARMTEDEVLVDIDLGLGDGEATVWTCDLSEEYVRINARYLT